MDFLRHSLILLILVAAVLHATDANGRNPHLKKLQDSVDRNENDMDGELFSTSSVLTPITSDNLVLMSIVAEEPEEDDESFDDYEDVYEIDHPMCTHPSQGTGIPNRQQLQNFQPNNRKQFQRRRQSQLQQQRKQKQHQQLREQEVDQAMELLLRRIQQRIQRDQVQKNRQQVNKRNVWTQDPTNRGNRKRFFRTQE